MRAIAGRDGAAAGLRAGAIVAVLAAIKAASDGSGLGYPAKLVAAAWWGTPALISGAIVALLGLATHLAFSAALGEAFVKVAPSWARVKAGLAYGGLLWAVMTFGVLPLLDRTMSARMALTPYWWATLHLTFGLALAWRSGDRAAAAATSCSAAGSAAASSRPSPAAGS